MSNGHGSLGNSERSVLVTGASSGIGAATALAFAKQGATLLLHYNSKAADVARVCDDVRSLGAKCEAVQADLSTQQGLDSLVQIVRGRKFDVLVNNAGSLLQRAKTADVTGDLWARVMMLNMTSAFFISQAAVEGMLQRGGGVIVNISSIAARSGGNVGAIGYASSKAALSCITKGLSKEFAAQGIRVNALSPGTIETPFHDAFSTPEGLAAVRASTPTGRLGTAEEIADVIVYLASEQARFIHGQTIEVNGGALFV